MSPRAACRLEALGYPSVADYVAGKADWLAHALPREGERAHELRAVDLAVDDVVTCGLRERVGDVRARVAGSRHRFAFVVSADRVLLGRLRHDALIGDPDTRAEAVMEPGPSTVRPDTALEPLVDRMRSNDLTSLPITDPEGHLLGLIRRQDLERASFGEDEHSGAAGA